MHLNSEISEYSASRIFGTWFTSVRFGILPKSLLGASLVFTDFSFYFLLQSSSLPFTSWSHSIINVSNFSLSIRQTTVPWQSFFVYTINDVSDNFHNFLQLSVFLLSFHSISMLFYWIKFKQNSLSSFIWTERLTTF